MIRLIIAGLVLAGALRVSAATHAAYAGVLVLFGVPGRLIGPDGIAAALAASARPVACVEPAAVEAKGSRPFAAATEAGEPLFIKVTYWLPVLPGWLSWRVLQRREYA